MFHSWDGGRPQPVAEQQTERQSSKSVLSAEEQITTILSKSSRFGDPDLKTVFAALLLTHGAVN